ncbi:MAG: GIY-YIG nuclease family protein, partial [Ruminococcus sp.]
MNVRLPFLREKTAKLTTSPGVYIMKNKSGEIIYIGKAKNLKNRVTSYFREGADHTPKVASMVSNVYDYNFIVTDSEYEALVLECSMIKQHQPKYNILLKDDKGYSYIRISDEPYPRITAEKNKDKPGKYLGPYMSGTVPRETVAEVNRVFRLPTCHKKFPDDFRKGRPCLNYHINLCSGLCRGKISRKEYGETIEQAVEYIKGGSEESAKRMEKQ